MRFTQCSLALALALASLHAEAQPASGQPASGMSAGGLAPPPAVEPPPVEVAPTATEQELARADREDSGRGLQFVWLDAEVGIQHVGLQTFHENKLLDAGLVESTQTGALFGAGAGVRLIFLTAGARFRLSNMSAWRLWTLGAEFGLRIPLGSFEPYFTFGGGYASLGSFDPSKVEMELRDAGLGVGDLSARGFNLRGGAGFDYYFGHTLSVGANLSGDVLFLSRSKATPSTTPPAGGRAAELAALYSQDGSSIGGGVALTGSIGLHF